MHTKVILTNKRRTQRTV